MFYYKMKHKDQSVELWKSNGFNIEGMSYHFFTHELSDQTYDILKKYDIVQICEDEFHKAKLKFSKIYLLY